MPRILTLRTLYGATLSLSPLLTSFTIALLSTNLTLLHIEHLLQILLTLQVITSILLFPILIHKSGKEYPDLSLITDSLIFFSVTIPFSIIAALVTSTDLLTVLTLQILLLSMLFLSVSVVRIIRSSTAFSIFLFTVLSLSIVTPLLDEMFAQTGFRVRISIISPIVFVNKIVSQKISLFHTVAISAILLVSGGILWLFHKADKRGP